MTSSPFRPAAIAAVATAALCPLGVADSIPDGHLYELSLLRPNATAAAAGEVTGDGLQDLLVLADGEVSVHSGPSNYDVAFDLALPTGAQGPVTAIAVEEPGQLGVVDRVLATDGTGLIAWEYDSVAQAFASSILLSDQAVAGAQSIELRDVDTDGDNDLLLLSSSGQDVVVLWGDGAGGFSLGHNIAIGSDLVEVTAGESDATESGEELLVVRDGSIEVRSSVTGTVLSSVSLIGPALTAVRIREASGSGFSLAILEGTAGFQWLTTWRPSGGLEAPFPLGALNCRSIGAGDSDGDGDDDPILVATFTPTMLLLINRVDVVPAGTATYSALHAITTDYAPYGTNVAGQVAPAVRADFDGDGDADTAIPCSATGQAFFGMNASVTLESTLRPIIEPGEGGPNEITMDCGAGGMTTLLNIPVTAPATLPSATYNDLRAEVWVPGETVPRVTNVVSAPAPGGAAATLLVETEDLVAGGAPSSYSLLLRFERSSAGVVLEAAPPLVIELLPLTNAASCSGDGINPPLPYPDPVPTPLPRPNGGG